MTAARKAMEDRGEIIEEMVVSWKRFEKRMQREIMQRKVMQIKRQETRISFWEANKKKGKSKKWDWMIERKR